MIKNFKNYKLKIFLENVFSKNDVIEFDINELNLQYLKNYFKIDNTMISYDDMFPKHIRERGISYFKANRIKNIIKNGTKYNSIIIGNSNNYQVEIDFENNMVPNFKCNCPYFEENEICKHTYALLYSVKLNEHMNNIKSEKSIQKLIKQYNNNVKLFEKMTKKFYSIDNYIEDSNVLSKVEEIEKHLKEKLNYEFNGTLTLLQNFLDVYKANYTLKNILEKYLNQEELKKERLIKEKKVKIEQNKLENSYNNSIFDENNNSDNEESNTDLFVLFSYCDKKEIVDEELEKRMEGYGLSEHEKDIIRNSHGAYDPWDFDEEDDDPDGYYSEDID